MSSPKSLSELQDELDQLDPRYRLERIIGSGSYGMVLKARDAVDNTHVAIKRVNKEIFEELILAKRILREIRLLAHFSDDNIVGLRNLLTPKEGDHFEYFYIIMDIMETDLKQVLRSGQKLTDAHVQFFIYQALRSLRVIHAAGVIHRDITPANILVNTNCDLKMCDFGLAKEESDDGEDMTDYVTMRWYRAPELVMEHRAYDAQIDVWGVGCIMAELLGSKPLFQGKDRVNQLDKIVETLGTPSEEEISSVGSVAAQKYIRKKAIRPRVNWSERFPNAPPDALDLLEKLLEFHPQKRIKVSDAMRHPYLSSLYDPEDENVNPGLFCFDEHQQSTVSQVKHAIVQESVKFHQRFPRSAPPKSLKIDTIGSQERAMGEATLHPLVKDEGRYEEMDD